MTTPDPVTLHKTLAELAAEGVTHLALEASSHGLDQFRLDGVTLTAAAFNNLGRDHLDYHPTMKAYLDAKLRLFRDLMLPGQTVVVNEAFVDVETLKTVADAMRGRGLNVISSGRGNSTLALEMLHRDGDGQGLQLKYNGRSYNVRFDLVGAYQAHNALVAAGLAIACGEDPAAAINAIAQLKGVKGRLETVGKSASGGLVLVDYAHKPEALAAALTEIRKFMGATGKLVCVFGCGGDRDRGKRPIMGQIARELANAVVVTNDNPRSEDPAAIIKEIVSSTIEADRLARIAIKQFWGQPHGAVDVRTIPDRAEAIQAGVAMLGEGDVLLVAGKGHETGQIIGDKVLPFSDQDEVRKALAETGA